MRQIGIVLALLLMFSRTLAPAAAQGPLRPAVLDSFSPSGVLPGAWSSDGPSTSVRQFVGVSGTCDGASRQWHRSDGVRLRFAWVECGQDQADRLALDYAKARDGLPGKWRARSVLAGHADVVFAKPDGSITRGWLQGRFNLSLNTGCAILSVDECAAVSAPAASYLSTRLPGAATVDAGVPGAGKLVGALVIGWVMLVGLGRLAARLNRQSFNPGDRDLRLRRVDQAARSLRRRARGRWWGLFLAGSAAVLGLVAVVLLVRHSGRGAVTAAGWALVLAVPAFLLLRRFLRPDRQYPPRPAEAAQAPQPDASLRPAVSTPAPPTGRPTPRRGCRTTLSGLLLLFLTVLSLAVPLGALAVWYVTTMSLVADDELSRILIGLLVVAVAAGYGIDRFARRLRARTAQEAMQKDTRDQLLYLRNFGDDHQRIPASRLTRRGAWQRATGWLNPVRNARLEEVVAPVLARYGPLTAVAPPMDRLQRLAPELGAARTTLPNDDTWIDQVTQWATEARAVVVSASPIEVRPGLLSELRMLEKEVTHGQVVLVLGNAPKRELYQRFGAFLRTVEDYRLFERLAEGWVTDGVLVLVHVPTNGWGTWFGWGAAHRTAWTYAAAMEAAMAFADVEWKKPARPYEPLQGLELTVSLHDALRGAAAAAAARPIDTGNLLRALADADVSGQWSRIRLLTGGLDALTDRTDTGSPGPPAFWGDAQLTPPCTEALRTARRLSLRYRLGPIPIAAVVLGLVSSPNSAVARAWAPDPERWQQLLNLVQEDLLTVELPNLVPTVLKPPGIATSDSSPPERPGPRPT